MSQNNDYAKGDDDDVHYDSGDDVIKTTTKAARPTTAKGPKTPVKVNPRQLRNDFENRQTLESLEVVECGEDKSSTSNQSKNNQPSTSREQAHSSRDIRPPRKNSRSFVDVSEQERRVGEQGRFLLNLFIQEQAEEAGEQQRSIIQHVCDADREQARENGFSDESLTDIALTLRKIGDDISRNTDLTNFIEKVPVDSTKDVFVKVCQQIFQDGDLNWGRVVALFYFAYRLIMRAVTRGMDSLPWVREMLQWAGDFLVKHVSKWILSRGGWKMIKEWFGPSYQTLVLLTVLSFSFACWAYLKD